MKLYKYLYYRLYAWNLKTWGLQDIPQWNALLGVSAMIFLNLFTIAGVLDILGTNIIDNLSKNEIIVIINIILVINYFWLVHNGRYKRIAEKYKDEPKNKRLRNAILLWLYVIMSFVIISFVAILEGKLKGLR